MVRIRFAVVVVLGLVVGACSQSGASSPPGASTSAAPASGGVASFTAESVSVGEALAQIRGHQLVSLALYRAGDQQGALTHAGHPIAEVFPTLKLELVEHGGDAAGLEASLKTAADAVDDKAPVDDVAKAFNEAAALTVAAERTVVGSAADGSAYRASVIASLLVTAGREYEEAVADGAVRELIEYQDAYAFVNEARRLYDGIAADVRSKAPGDADEIDRALASLAGALPTVEPPASPKSVADVQALTAQIGHALTAAVGALAVEGREPEEVVAEIGRMLDAMVEAYRAGRSEEAMEIAAETYLSNYELIEAAVIAAAPEINAELEPLLAAEMRATMREGKPVAELEAKVARAKELLAEAVGKIPPDEP